MTPPIDARERSQLCDLMVELGPDAPTLCEGWTTSDLAAHLVLREHFKRWPDEQIRAEKAKGFPSSIARLRSGAPLIPWRVPGIRTLLNGLEYFVHHEDVRRANGRGPRTDTTDLEKLCWKMTGFLGRRLARKIRPFGLELKGSSGQHRRFGSGEIATIGGPATEIALYLSGRRAAASVNLSGSEAAVAAVEKAGTNL